MQSHAGHDEPVSELARRAAGVDNGKVDSFRRLLLLACLGTCALAPAGAIEREQEAAALDRWHAERLATLTSETGWLTLVGLYWFHDGANGFGRARSNAIALDHPALDRHAGKFVLSGGTVRFEPSVRSCVRHDGQPVAGGALVTDSDGEPTLLSCGSLQFWVIERAGRFGLRIRDSMSQARREFHGLDYFPVDADWALEARFEPYQPVRHVPIVNVLGMELDLISPGAVVFEREGREWRLDALLEDPTADGLFLMFADGTSGRESYGAGRFLYTPLPSAGHVAVDFNRAYNPPCAFTRFATCPLPPAQNRIELRVTAGELRYGE
jgi:uncharacterized protein